MASAIAGLRTPNGAVAPRIRADIEDLAADVELIGTPTVASTSVRDGLYASAIAAGKVGMRCYVTNRGGFSVYQHVSTSTKAWVWEGQQRPLAMETRTSDADSTAGSLVDIISVGPFTLPSGNRLVEVRIRSQATQLSGASTTEAKPQLQVIGSGFAAGYNSVTRLTTFPGAQTSVEATFLVVTSGAVSFGLKGRDGHETVAQNIRFAYSVLQVIDRGPTDF